MPLALGSGFESPMHLGTYMAEMAFVLDASRQEGLGHVLETWWLVAVNVDESSAEYVIEPWSVGDECHSQTTELHYQASSH